LYITVLDFFVPDSKYLWIFCCNLVFGICNPYFKSSVSVYCQGIETDYHVVDDYGNIQSVFDENRRFSNSISSLNSEVAISKHNVKVLQSSLKSEIDLKTLAEQRYEDERKLRMDAELKVSELEKKLPKRDSKGRYCKK
jgi:hypothetical protein